MIELTPQANLLFIVVTGALVALLVAVVLLRPRIFTQYLEHMTGIHLHAADVARVFRSRGQAGVRDMFLELIIREDMRGGPRILPDTPPDCAVLVPEEHP